MARNRSATYPGQRSVRSQPTKHLPTAAGTAPEKIAGWDFRDGFEVVATLELQSRVGTAAGPAIGSTKPGKGLNGQPWTVNLLMYTWMPMSVWITPTISSVISWRP